MSFSILLSKNFVVNLQDLLTVWVPPTIIQTFNLLSKLAIRELLAMRFWSIPHKKCETDLPSHCCEQHVFLNTPTKWRTLCTKIRCCSHLWQGIISLSSKAWGSCSFGALVLGSPILGAQLLRSNTWISFFCSPIRGGRLSQRKQ